jgi:hypothetical protein
MLGLGPGIHVFLVYSLAKREHVDGRVACARSRSQDALRAFAPAMTTDGPVEPMRI